MLLTLLTTLFAAVCVVGTDNVITLDIINTSRHDASLLRTRHQHLPAALSHELQIVEHNALRLLLDAMEAYIKKDEPITNVPPPRPFEHVVPAFYVHQRFVHLSDGKGGEQKYFVGGDSIRAQGKNFVVYALGIAGYPQFENYMAGLGASVYGFDCTDYMRPEYKFHFYPWCVGQNTSTFDEGNAYNAKIKGSKIFMPLTEITQKLGHKRIDILKFDIEGFEWTLFKDVLLNTDPESLPEQLLFELHTEGANPAAVPAKNIFHKRHHQVNELVFQLWVRGYRCINVELNAADGHCAELAFLRLPDPLGKHTHLHNSRHIGKHTQPLNMESAVSSNLPLAASQEVNRSPIGKTSDISRSLTVWSSDFHISPPRDIKEIFKVFGTKMIDKSLSGHCKLTSTCQTDLRVLTSQNGINLAPCPNVLRSQFYDQYISNKEFMSVDAILCTHADSMCEIFMPFEKPLIVVASTRYEIGRYEEDRWSQWNHNLQKIAAKPGNVVGANNVYDLEYMKYFTGIQNIQLLPTLALYVSARYSPTKREILLCPSTRPVAPPLYNELMGALDVFKKRYKLTHAKNTIADGGLVIAPVRSLYKRFEYSDLAAHPAIILMPYQLSVMSFFEFYRMGIPMFVPSPQLLTHWHMKHSVLKERSWNMIFDKPGLLSAVKKHPDYKGPMLSDPNDNLNFNSVLEWVKLGDFYTFPHVQQFDNLTHLVEMVGTTSLQELNVVSTRMRVFSETHDVTTLKSWGRALQGVSDSFSSARARPAAFSGTNQRRSGINDALMSSYGLQLNMSDCLCQLPLAPGTSCRSPRRR